MHFICRSFSGNSESASQSRYWENDPDDPILKSIKGHLFALININCPEDKDLNSIGHDISYEFNQTYYNSEDHLDILTNLSQSIDSILKNPLYSDYKIDFLTAVVLKNEVFLATFGESKVIFKRQDQISILLNNLDNEIETLTGPLLNNDRIFLLTNSFFEKISWRKIKQFLSDSKIQNVEENFLSAIYSQENQNDLSAVFIEIESDEESVVSQEYSESPSAAPIVEIEKPSSVFIGHHETNETGKRKRLSLFIGIILIIFLAFSLYFGYQKNQSKKIETKYQALKTEIQSQIENINQTKNLSLDSARLSATEAQKTIEKMVALKVHQDEIESFNFQLNEILSQTGSSDSFTPDFYYDANTITNSPQFQKIIFNDNKLYLLDSQNGRIDYIDINNNKLTKSVIASDKVKSAINFAIDKTNLYLMTKEEISLVEKNTLTSKIKLTDINPVDFKFWNGAAYVLDSANQSIWKFNPNSTGFSKAQDWLKNDAKLDQLAISLSINGKIWVLHQNGSISSYLSGVKSEFKPSQSSQFTQTNNIDVTQQKELLTFIDNDNMIYLYQKTGELLKKFNLGNLKINDIAFNEANNKIFVLCTDQKIYFIKF